MSSLLAIILLVVVVLFGASQFRYRGYVWADQVCLSAFGLCNEPYWLGGVAALLVGILSVLRDGN
jgi:hypothetical protein